MAGLSGISKEVVENYATHNAMDDILRGEVATPKNKRIIGESIRQGALSIIWGANAWGRKAGLHEKMDKVSRSVQVQLATSH